jgi:heptosyltransferase I
MKAPQRPPGILAPVMPSTQFWPDLAARDFQRILIIKPSAVGDIVRTLPVLTALRRRWPKAHIAWLVARHCSDVLADHPALSQVICFDRKAYAQVGRNLSISRAFTQFLQELRQCRFDLVIDIQGLFRSAFFSFATGAAVRIGRGDSRELAGLFYTHRAAVDERRMHAIVLNAGMVAPLGVKVQPATSDLYISPQARAAARRILGENGLAAGTRYAVIAPGTNWETKTWPAERFGQVAAGLRRRYDLRSVVVGTGSHAEMARQILQQEPTAIDLCGKSSLAELVAMIEGAAIVIANESGPIHMADALDTPLVAVVGPTRPEIVGPFRRTDGVIRASLPCLGCGIKKLARCPHTHRCMNSVTADDVLDLAGRQLGRPREETPCNQCGALQTPLANDW